MLHRGRADSELVVFGRDLQPLRRGRRIGAPQQGLAATHFGLPAIVRFAHGEPRFFGASRWADPVPEGPPLARVKRFLPVRHPTMSIEARRPRKRDRSNAGQWPSGRGTANGTRAFWLAFVEKPSVSSACVRRRVRRQVWPQVRREGASGRTGRGAALPSPGCETSSLAFL
jgi:hypothetical protein